MSYETILYDENDHIGLLTLNRPQTVNALNLKMIEELEQVFNELNESETVRVHPHRCREKGVLFRYGYAGSGLTSVGTTT